MKKIILSLLLAVSTVVCSKETHKPVVCMDAKEMFDAIKLMRYTQSNKK